MLPPVLEIYVIWHPGDAEGLNVAEQFVQHFHGTPFTGLIGGAVEVFIRSEGWCSLDDAPRPIPATKTTLPNKLDHAKFTAIVPLMGTEMAAAAERNSSPWKNYIEQLIYAQSEMPRRMRMFPCLIDQGASDATVLGRLLGPYQRIAASPPDTGGETDVTLRCRDLAQGIAQWISSPDHQRLTVFISHTKRASPGDEEDTTTLVELVRTVIRNTHLREFFDTSDLQPGTDWDAELRSKASTSALLGIRTDLYPSREWCQREIRIAKQQGMPVIIIDAPGKGEERGSFLMDHVPRIPVRKEHGCWNKKDVYQALNLLVDECLKRALWIHQKELSSTRTDLGIAWWAPHAPEPLTLVHWFESVKQAGTLPPGGLDLRVLHPDPPLGPDEILVLEQVLSLARPGAKLDVMTPRLLASRGG